MQGKTKTSKKLKQNWKGEEVGLAQGSCTHMGLISTMHIKLRLL